jgi:multiple sugar transport system substrate-binding protein/sorbitol/mannitol transport system substrate-binding protein
LGEYSPEYIKAEEKRMKKQKIFSGLMTAILLITVLAVPVFARGGNDSSAQSSRPLNVLMQAQQATDGTLAVLDEFVKATGIKVNIDVLPYEQMVSKAQVALSSGDSSYDVIQFDYMYTVQFANANWIRDLGPFIQSSNYDVNDFLPGFMNALSYNGKTYALPVYGESTMLVYNKELFAKAGITKVPGTKAEFEDTLNKLKAAGVPVPFVGRGARDPGQNVYVWSGFFLGMGGKWFTNGKLTVNSPAGVESMKYYANLLRNYGTPGGTLTHDQVLLNMQQGNAAMMIDTTNWCASLENPANSTVVGKVGYAETPADLAAPSVFCTGFAIPTAARNPEASWKFIQWALSKEVQLSTTLSGDRIDVTRKSVMNDPNFLTKVNYDNGNWLKAALGGMSKCDPDYRPRIADWAKLGDVVAGALSSVTSGQATAEAALAQVDAEAGNIKP